MPTILDATVVNSAYDTSGNGGRKIDSNKYGIFEVVYSATEFFLYKTNNDGNSVQVFSSSSGFASVQDVSLVATDKKILVLALLSNNSIRVYEFNAETGLNASKYFQSVQSTFTFSSLGKGSIIANDTETEVHITWSGKATSPNYSNSFNPFHVKGTINADGTVTWGAVVQLTVRNAAGYDLNNPSIALKDSQPYIFASGTYELTSSAGGGNGTGKSIIVLTNNKSLFVTTSQVHNDWSIGNVYVTGGANYAQANPSAISIPQEIAIKNPLFASATQGVLVVSWHGFNATNTTYRSLYFSYSLDGGITWNTSVVFQGVGTSGMSVLEGMNASITANRLGRLDILFDYFNLATYDVACITNSNGTWGSPVIIKDKTDNVLRTPSTLYDPYMDYSDPLFIYKDTAKVGFYGTWTVTTISVTQGSIGQKTDNTNLLSYSITTDGTMSTITEKVNGVVVGTKTATSGQSLIAGLTQEQWNAVRFGKYADATGGKNTLTIEMGSEKWTYTFDKRLADDSDLVSVVKAVQDSNEVQLPTIKKMLVDKVGGNVEDSFEDIIANGFYGKKWASGTAMSSSSSFVFTGSTGSTYSAYTVTVAGLAFKPSKIFIHHNNGTPMSSLNTNQPLVNGYNLILVNSNQPLTRLIDTANVTDNGFTLISGSPNAIHNWFAIE